MKPDSSFFARQIAIVGFGVEGQSAAKYFSSKGADVTICDANEQLPVSGYNAVLGKNYLKNLGRFDLIVRSPSIRPDSLINIDKVTSSTEYFLQNSPSLTIGVTGSKGKGTASTLIHKLLESLGQKTWLGGNIGTPVLDFLDKVETSDMSVLELSSFQLMGCQASPNIAVCLMIEPDHMNWHKHMAEYINAKARITSNQSKKDYFICHPSNLNSQKLYELAPGNKLKFNQKPNSRVEVNQIIFDDLPLLNTHEVGLIGRHNLENITAALTTIETVFKLKPELKTAVSRQQIKQTIQNFKGLPHRLEFVRELNGVKFYNDSFATMPDAAIAGINTFKSVIAIVGGVDKQVELSLLAKAITKTKFTVLIGEIAPQLASLLNGLGFKNYQIVRGQMSEIVETAYKSAGHGDVVSLEPGSSSFDMFESYKKRGELFKLAVNQL